MVCVMKFQYEAIFALRGTSSVVKETRHIEKHNQATCLEAKQDQESFISPNHHRRPQGQDWNH
jgi:hypothetical protein